MAKKPYVRSGCAWYSDSLGCGKNDRISRCPECCSAYKKAETWAEKTHRMSEELRKELIESAKFTLKKLGGEVETVLPNIKDGVTLVKHRGVYYVYNSQSGKRSEASSFQKALEAADALEK